MQPDRSPSVGSTDDPNELFDLIDEHDEVIGTVRRGEAHINPSLWHRSVQVLVFNTGGRVLLQRRSARKDLFPCYFCASASGHVAAGEDYTATAHREVREELGVELPLIEVGKRLVYSPSETEMTALFLARSDGPFTFHPTETDGGDFFALGDLLPGGTATALPMTPALLVALDMLATPEVAEGIQTLFPLADSESSPVGPSGML